MAQDKRDGHDSVEKEYATLGGGEGPAPEQPLPTKRLIALIAGPALAVLLFFLPAPEGMNREAWRLVALAVWMVVWWLGEAVPIPATALLPILMMPLLEGGQCRVAAIGALTKRRKVTLARCTPLGQCRYPASGVVRWGRTEAPLMIRKAVVGLDRTYCRS
jgi:hypothetical protein